MASLNVGWPAHKFIEIPPKVPHMSNADSFGTFLETVQEQEGNQESVELLRAQRDHAREVATDLADIVEGEWGGRSDCPPAPGDHWEP